MLKPVCTSCKLFFRMKKGGYYFIEGMPNGPDETDDELEKRASDLWRKENPTMSVFACDEEMKKRYRARARAAPERWQPYKVWSGDLWRCPGCGIEIISGFGAFPLAERHHHDFAHVIEHTGAMRLQVNDC